MVERHYDDEALIALLESRRESMDAHLPSCAPCAEKLESFRLIADALQDADVWDQRELRTEAIPSTIAVLRNFADRMAYEDSCADAILAELLAGGRESWMPRLRAHPEWRTGGVVRGLIARAYDALMVMPPDALEMLTVATEIADHLDPSHYPSDTVAHLRGAAWRDRAYALFYMGTFSEALSAVDRADEILAACVVDEYDRARVGIVRSLVLRAFERLDEAERVVAESASAFMPFEDLERFASARLAEVHLLAVRCDYDRMYAVLDDLDRRLAGTRHLDAHARVLGNLGNWAKRVGKFDLAVQYFDMASDVYDTLEVQTEAARIRWSVAQTLIQIGSFDEARVRLSAVMPDLERLGMTWDVALCGLDLAELHLANGRYQEVEAICRRAMDAFIAAGLRDSSGALTALGYMSEAARLRVADGQHVRTVREYIRQLPAKPNLLFAPPPLS